MLVRSARFWAGVGLIVLAIALFTLNGGAIAEEQQYARDGQFADGLVVGKAIKRSMRAGSTEAQTEHALTYRFTVGANSFEGEHTVTREAWDRARELEPIRIEYLAAAPTVNRVADHTRGRLPYVLGGVGLIAGVIGMVAVSRAIRETRLSM
ncbi:MAG TPA: DUF3592 domain-containing protein [Vicinamibacterales bacterium]|nr:DUF3592 domain-containing protein [Vicinamibacterales bacterium]